MSYKVEVRVGADPLYYSNACRFETKPEAEAYARDLHRRWTSVREFRVAECHLEPNQSYAIWQDTP